MKPQTKTIKAWIIANKDGVCYGGVLEDNSKLKAVFKLRKDASHCKTMAEQFYRGDKILRCTIIYTLPTRPKKAAKK